MAALAALEVGLRLDGRTIALLDWERGLRIEDPRLGWRGRPSARRWLENGDFDVYVENGADGFRRPGLEPPAGASSAVLVLGGATAWGEGVGQGQLLSDWLQRALPPDVAVENRAVPGHSLAGNHAVLRDALASARFREVIVVVTPRELQEEAAGRDAAGGSLRVALEERSRAALLLSRGWDLLWRAADGGAARRTAPPDLGEAERWLTEASRLCRESDVRLVLVFGPNVARAPSGDATRDRVARLAARHELPFLDLTDALPADPEASPPVFHRATGTWSHRAHLLAAHALLESGLLEASPVRAAAPLPPGFRSIGPQHRFVRYVGRVDRSRPGRVRFDWPAVAIRLRIEGEALRLQLRSEKRRDHFDVRVDGEPFFVWSSSQAERVLALEGLGPGVHEIEVRKRTEVGGAVVFSGLELPVDGRLLPPGPAPERRIEVLGASLAGGMGNQGRLYGHRNEGRSSRDCADIRRSTDSTASFGAQLADRLGAELHLTAATATGIIRNFGDEEPSEDHFPRHFVRVLSSEPGDWDFSAWIPQVVVVNLGENDFWDKEGPGDETFLAGYRRFIASIRERYPEAWILAFHEGRRFARLRGLVQGFLEERRRAGDARIELLTFPRWHKRREQGCNSHPITPYHRMLADRLAARVESLLEASASAP